MVENPWGNLMPVVILMAISRVMAVCVLEFGDGSVRSGIWFRNKETLATIACHIPSHNLRRVCAEYIRKPIGRRSLYV
jgi:hypothetical protein